MALVQTKCQGQPSSSFPWGSFGYKQWQKTYDGLSKNKDKRV